MDYETERKYLCKFSLETPIYDVDLPNKIKDKLNSLDLHPDPEKVYHFDVRFSGESYLELDFYEFPVELQNDEKDKSSKADRIRRAVISKQIHDIYNAIEPFNINFDSNTIARTDLIDDINQVEFCIYEDNIERKNGKTHPSFIIIQDISFTVKNFIETFDKIIKRHNEEEKKRQLEKTQSTPNMKGVEEITIALATAILKDRPNKSLSPEKLSREMLVQAKIECDWPLEIRGYAGACPIEHSLISAGEIDCPEYLVYVKCANYWVLSKAASLEEAKETVLYNCKIKSVEQVIVLHNLKNVKYNLFTEHNGEVEPISKKEAHTAKKLLLSWVKSRK